MPIEHWSDQVTIVHLSDDPQFSDELETFALQSKNRSVDVVLDMKAVHHVNSSNISQLLKIRKKSVASEKRVILCQLNNQVWGVFLVTGLDKIFEFADNVMLALATLQVEGDDAGVD
jgi:anti-anti-sigma factor